MDAWMRREHETECLEGAVWSRGGPRSAEEERWAAEYLAMAAGVITHAAQQARIARFVLQHADRYSVKAVAWARAVVSRAE